MDWMGSVELTLGLQSSGIPRAQLAIRSGHMTAGKGAL